MTIEKENIRKILCIKPRGIGDIVNSTIIIDNLKNFFPSATIDYLVEPFATHAVEYLPEVNKVINMKNREFPLKVALRIRKEKYDLLLDTWCNPRTAQISFLSGVKYRVGFAYRGREYAYNILATSARGKSHSAEHNLEILNPLNIPVVSKRIHYQIPDDIINDGKKFINANFKGNTKIIGIIPAGGWKSKRCDAEKWVEIINALSNKYSVQFLILWGPGDEQDATYIKENTGENCVLAPNTSLIEMSGLIKNCDIILANDSGPMHISAAMNIPTLGIFGPTDPEAHRPYAENSDYIIKDDLDCIICNKFECPFNHECMRQLDVSKVLNKIEKIGRKILN